MRTRHLGRARLGRATVILAVPVLILLTACGGAASVAPYGGGGAASMAPQAPAATQVPQTASGNGGNGNNQGGQPGQTANPVLDAARRDLLVIKTGLLTIEVEHLDDAVGAATAEIAGLGGYVSGSSQTGAGDQVTASVTYRIPADRWDEALVAIRTLAKTVVAEQTQTEDVEAQVVDLAARVKNLEATERAVQAVMDKATTIEDILNVQQELTRIRGEIEQAASQKADLTDRAIYSTLTVRFGLVPAPAPSATPTPTASPAPGFDAGAEVAGATDTLVGILQVVATGAIWFGIVWVPVLLALALVVVPLIVYLRRRALLPEALLPPPPPASPTPPSASAGT